MKINLISVNNPGCTNDTTIRTDKLEALQQLLTQVVRKADLFVLTINTSRTKVKVVYRKNNPPAIIVIYEQQMETVNKGFLSNIRLKL